MDVSRETSERLATYADLIRKWTPGINLISPESIADLERRHIANSIWIVRAAPENQDTWLDLGSGAGLPGVVAAILNPQTQITLVEKDRRKCEFLRTVRRELGLKFQIVNARIQDHPRSNSSIISARALAPMARLLHLAAPHSYEDTVFIFPKGRTWQSEVDEAARSWAYDLDVVPDPDAAGSALLKITNLRERDYDMSNL